MSRPNAQSMKPATAAKKLDVYLPATPVEFQENAITRSELAALQEDPRSGSRISARTGRTRRTWSRRSWVSRSPASRAAA